LVRSEPPINNNFFFKQTNKDQQQIIAIQTFMPSWEKLPSSALSGCRFIPSTTNEFDAASDEQTGTLEIQFTNGNEYSYDEVPVSVYTGLLAAPSPGRYYNEMIKGQYE
jgi:hypothetical protein